MARFDNQDLERQRTQNRRFIVVFYCCFALACLGAAHASNMFGEHLGYSKALTDQIATAFALLGLGNILALLALEALARAMRTSAGE